MCFDRRHLIREGEKFPRVITTSWGFDWDLRDARRQLRKDKNNVALQTEVRQLVDLSKIAERYEAECWRIRQVSETEYAPAREAVTRASRALAELTGAILKQPDKSMAGVLVKAEALDAWGKIHDTDKFYAAFEPYKWNGQIAASILRHAKGAAT